MSSCYLRDEYLIAQAKWSATQKWMKINMSQKHKHFVDLCNNYQKCSKTAIKQTSIKEVVLYAVTDDMGLRKQKPD